MHQKVTRVTQVTTSIIALLATALSCSKPVSDDPPTLKTFAAASVVYDACVTPADIDTFSAEQSVPTLLGPPLKGQPFSSDVMKQAQFNLYGRNTRMQEMYYVRFKPANQDQLITLVNSGMEFTDYPLDCDVIREGDYYPQAGVGDNDIPWLYAMVPLYYVAPTGITYEVLQRVSETDDLAIETEALRITGNLDIINEDSCSFAAAPMNGGVSTMDEGPRGRCTRNPDGTLHCEDALPPVPGTDYKQPAGYIRHKDKQLNQDLGVPNVKVIARRWFKSQVAYTDNTGKFVCSKRFRNKVNVVVKMTNPYVEIRAIKSIQFWQLWFPVKASLGKYSGRLNNIGRTFIDDGRDKTNTHKLWYAATTMACYADYNAMATAQGIGLVPTALRILLTTHGKAGAGSTPMNNHRSNAGAIPRAWIDYFIAYPGVATLSQLYNYLYNTKLLTGVDISLGYHEKNPSSSDVRNTIYHEFTHAAHFPQVGQVWWNTFVYAESSEIARHGVNGPLAPYGDGSQGSISDYIGLGESWAYHMGHFMADRTYGAAAAPTSFNAQVFSNNNPLDGLSSQLNAIENFNPTNTNAPFRWMPSGVYYDLIDTRNEDIPLIDRVSGYTNQQFYNALQPEITSVRQFRDRLLTNSGNNQQADVNKLFTQYGF